MTIAMIFPGQGSQSVGMLNEFQDVPVVVETFNEASEVLGYDLWQLVQHGPEEKLNQTNYTQVSMLTADISIFRVLKQNNINPEIMAGHSLGEYAALVAGESLDFKDAVKLVLKRAQFMQQTTKDGVGKMAAIVGLSAQDVEYVCEKASDLNQMVSPANYNAIGQIVIAGHTNAVIDAIKLAQEQGAKLAKIIPVSVPCHCVLLKDAAELFEESLNDTRFKIPNVAIVSNVDLSIYDSVENIRNLLKKQLYSPVRWIETIQLIKSKNINLAVECGPGRVLQGLVKRIDKTLPCVSVNDMASVDMLLKESF